MVAGLAVVYGLWYPALIEAQARKLPKHDPDAVEPKREIRALAKSRGLPLALAAVILTLVFLPPAVEVLIDALHAFDDQGFGAVEDYDAVSAALVIITGASALLSLHIARLTFDLFKKSR